MLSPTNTILVAGVCPACASASVLRVRTHVAASYHGDKSGPFEGRVYRIGERMKWWPRDQAWRFEGEPNQPCGHAVEACVGTCDRCQEAVYAVIHFAQLVPAEVLDLGLAQDWPVPYRRPAFDRPVRPSLAS